MWCNHMYSFLLNTLAADPGIYHHVAPIASQTDAVATAATGYTKKIHLMTLSNKLRYHPPREVRLNIRTARH